MMLLRDSRGRESTTLTFVTITWAIGTVKFAIGGFTLGMFGASPSVDIAAYGAFFLAILAPWLQREWTEKTKVQNANPSQT